MRKSIERVYPLCRIGVSGFVLTATSAKHLALCVAEHARYEAWKKAHG